MKISVITVCFNSEKTIDKTLESVDNQKGLDFEYIIVDGGSRDKTLKIISKWQNKISLKLISETDKGIYDAMNKGVRMATGDWVIFLNSDDYFYSSDSLANAEIFLDKELDIVYGSTEFRYDNFSVIRKPRPMSDLWKKMPYNHQSSFTRRSLLLKSPFNLDYRLASDYDFLVSSYKKNLRFKEVDLVISSFGSGGTSSQFKAAGIVEYESILKKYQLSNFKTFLYFKLLKTKPFLERISPKIISRWVYKNIVH